MTYACPVCGYSALPELPKDDLICPSCGTQFGYHDASTSHEQLRNWWLAAGAPWHSRRIPPPRLWNPMKQVLNAGLGYHLMATAELRTTAEPKRVVMSVLAAPISSIQVAPIPSNQNASVYNTRTEVKMIV